VDKLLAILGAGPDQLPAFIEAKKLGIKTLAIDMNPNSQAFDIADYRMVESTRNIPGIISKLKEFHNNNRNIDGVMTIAAEVSPSVAAIANVFGLPGVSEEVAYLTTNKCARAERFKQNQTNFPNYWIGNILEDFIDVKFPVVIKPSDNSASRGVQLVENYEHLQSCFSSALGYSSDKQVILEQYLKGFEVSIEGVVIEGKLHVTGFADRNYARNEAFYPFFVEDGGDIPTVLSQELVRKVVAEFEKAVSAIGIKLGPTKGDVIITPDGMVYVIEVTSRLSGGGFCSRTVPLTSGVNIVKTTIQLALGITPDISDLVQKFRKAMSHRFYFHKPGKIKAIIGLDQIASMPGIADCIFQRPFKVGDTLEPVTYANRLFYVIAVADDRETAIKYAENAIKSVDIIVE